MNTELHVNYIIPLSPLLQGIKIAAFFDIRKSLPNNEKIAVFF